MICKKCNSRQAEKGRTTCCHCNYLQKKLHNPIRIAYTSLKCHAKERGKKFSLTIEQFRQFCIEYEYINKKGIHKNSYHIDRIDETKGYEIDNIQLLTNTQNVRKYIAFVEINEVGKKIFKTRKQPDYAKAVEDCPF